MENRTIMICILISGAFAVALGAFGAHSLKPYMDDLATNTFQTANRYQFYHTFLAMAYQIWLPNDKTILKASWLALIGIILFSGSLYLLSLHSLLSAIPFWIGAITPIGGLCFILAWLLGIWLIIKKKKN